VFTQRFLVATIFLFASLCSSSNWVMAASAVQTFLFLADSPPLTATDIAKLAKYDVLAFNQGRANQVAFAGRSYGTWAAIKAANPKARVFVYKTGYEQPTWEDAEGPDSLGAMGRYNVSRGHSMGSLNGNLPQLFLLDAAGRRIYNADYSSGSNVLYVMDFGSPLYAKYWLEGIKTDLVGKPWAADGVYVDGCYPIIEKFSESATPVKYPTDAAWWSGMQQFILTIGPALRAQNQLFWCNMGDTRDPLGSAAWRALDRDTLHRHPDYVLEEGAFVAAWGPTDAQFFSEAQWRQQVELLRTITHYKIAFHSHTDLDGVRLRTGVDENGKRFDFWQALWYSLGSFMLGKNDVLNNAFFMFSNDKYDRIWWFDEYDKLDLGKALGNYQVRSVTSGGKPVNVYWRRFQRGYVFVNPNETADVTNLTLPAALRQRTHTNLNQAAASLPVVTTLARLRSHEAAVFLNF
jgi:Hypothetical glycosyl hydrolase family 15